MANDLKMGRRDIAKFTQNLDNFESDEEAKALVKKGLSQGLMYFGRPIVKTDEEAIERITEFFNDCVELGNRPTVEALALCLGTTRATLWDWETGNRRTISADIIKNAKELISNYDAVMVQEGKLNPVVYIFRSKNYYGMKDQQEHILTPNVQEATAEELIREAEMLPEIKE